MNVSKRSSKYDWECLSILANGISTDNPQITERKIKSRLRHNRLGDYDQTRIEMLRLLESEARREFTMPPQESKYYQGCKSGWADFADYDLPRLECDLAARFPDVSQDNISGIVQLSVFLHHIR